MRALAGVPPGIWLPAALLIAVVPVAVGCLRHWLVDQYCALFLLQIVLYGIAAWGLLKPNPDPRMYGRRALIAILIVAAVLRLIALCAPVYLSSDAYRYVWDGRVQAAGINPYRYIPADPQLSFLRDKTIYPDIIIHKRIPFTPDMSDAQKRAVNAVVIEAKKDADEAERGEDLEKLTAIKGEFLYQLAVFVNFHVDPRADPRSDIEFV